MNCTDGAQQADDEGQLGVAERIGQLARAENKDTGAWHKKYVVFRRMRYDWPFRIASRDDAIGSLLA